MSLITGRKEPLLIGAIKSVIGHTEGSSGLCSLVKTILTFESEMIPANLHMTKPNHRIEGLMTGILKPVTENTPYTGKYIGLNCFGFGGVNVHAVIRKHEKQPATFEAEILPRLVTVCGRNDHTVERIFKFIEENPKKITPDFLALLQEVSKTTPYDNFSNIGMKQRGYLLLEKDGQGLMKPSIEMKMQSVLSETQPKVCFVLTGMGCQWTAMGKELVKFDKINDSLEQCAAVLKKIDSSLDLLSVLTSDTASVLKTPINSFVSIAAIQIALIDFLEYLGITPDYILGHSIGELTSAYADKCLSLEETIACAYWRAKCIEDYRKKAGTPGAMAAIGCSWNQATKLCTELAENKVWPACNNGCDSVTVSGLKEDVDMFIEKLAKKNPDMFARNVQCSGVAFHCPLLESLEKDLLAKIEQVLKKGSRQRSAKWISTTYAENSGEFTARYLVDNLIKPVLFHEGCEQISPDCCFVEVAPHHLLQPIIKRNMMERTKMQIMYVPTLSRSKSNSKTLLENLGSLYTFGFNPKIELIYPKFQYPVARGTPGLNSFIEWCHDRSFTVTQYPEFFNIMKQRAGARAIDLGVSDSSSTEGY